MLDSKPLLFPTDFPSVRRRGIATLQVNLGYVCNQSCVHCHVDASPNRKEILGAETVTAVLRYLERNLPANLDLTGGAPELNPHFRRLVREARALGMHCMDRCNLTVLEEAGQEDLADFLARHDVEIIASLPCYLQSNVDRQRGNGVFDTSILALRRLNDLGYGSGSPRRRLNLVYNPTGPILPPPQCALEADYKRMLGENYGIRFDRLLTLTNMPVKRFGSMLQSQGKFDEYLSLLRSAHREENLEGVMCRDLISVDWRGFLYDCDFNQMLDLPLEEGGVPIHISKLDDHAIAEHRVQVGEHCYGCTAGQGSSCGGALSEAGG